MTSNCDKIQTLHSCFIFGICGIFLPVTLSRGPLSEPLSHTDLANAGMQSYEKNADALKPCERSHCTLPEAVASAFKAVHKMHSSSTFPKDFASACVHAPSLTIS